MPVRSAYIIAARRTALDRVGGLHRARRLHNLAAPVITACLKDAGISPALVGRLLVGNTSETGNPARLAALTVGLPDRAAALTMDMQCASGLTAIVDAIRLVESGVHEAVVAGGAEAISMAPWQVAKPRALHQSPRFVGIAMSDEDAAHSGQGLEADEALATRLKISRSQQDDFALRSHLKAGLAVEARRFLKEIVPLKVSADECRDQSATEPDMQELRDLPSLLGEGTLTAGNTSTLHDGAAFALVVSESMWKDLGSPPAMKLLEAAMTGLSAKEAVEAPIIVMRQVLSMVPAANIDDLGVIEMSETSAVQAIAFRNTLGLADEPLNPDGGAVVRGHPLGAAGAVLVTRLFTRMARTTAAERPSLGAAVLGARGGLGMAAVFESA